MQKHAYLIMAHGNFKILAILLSLLDDERNDIFIHIDKKVKNFDFNHFSAICKKSSVYYTPKRFNVKWGESSQVKNELQLYKTATKTGEYAYYHLISGVDLPLKTQDEIHDFFRHSNKEYIYYTKKPSLWDYQRLSRFRFPKKWNSKITSILYILQEKFKIDRFKKYNFAFQKGYNWCSLTNDTVKYLLDHKSLINKMCKLSVCADECYKQILLLNSEFKNNVFINSEGNPDDMREVDWINRIGDSPNIYTITDFENLKSSNKLFARKFDENVDFSIVKEIEKFIIERGK